MWLQNSASVRKTTYYIRPNLSKRDTKKSLLKRDTRDNDKLFRCLYYNVAAAAAAGGIGGSMNGKLKWLFLYWIRFEGSEKGAFKSREAYKEVRFRLGKERMK